MEKNVVRLLESARLTGTGDGARIHSGVADPGVLARDWAQFRGVNELSRYGVQVQDKTREIFERGWWSGATRGGKAFHPKVYNPIPGPAKSNPYPATIQYKTKVEDAYDIKRGLQTKAVRIKEKIQRKDIVGDSPYGNMTERAAEVAYRRVVGKGSWLFLDSLPDGVSVDTGKFLAVVSVAVDLEAFKNNPSPTVHGDAVPAVYGDAGRRMVAQFEKVFGPGSADPVYPVALAIESADGLKPGSARALAEANPNFDKDGRLYVQSKGTKKYLSEFTLNQLTLMALKAFPSSPIQKAIQAEISKRREAGEQIKHYNPNPDSSTLDAAIDAAARDATHNVKFADWWKHYKAANRDANNLGQEELVQVVRTWNDRAWGNVLQLDNMIKTYEQVYPHKIMDLPEGEWTETERSFVNRMSGRSANPYDYASSKEERLRAAEQIVQEITAHLAEPNTAVVIAVANGSRVVKVASDFKVKSDGLYMRRGKSWDYLPPGSFGVRFGRYTKAKSNPSMNYPDLTINTDYTGFPKSKPIKRGLVATLHRMEDGQPLTVKIDDVTGPSVGKDGLFADRLTLQPSDMAERSGQPIEIRALRVVSKPGARAKVDHESTLIFEGVPGYSYNERVRLTMAKTYTYKSNPESAAASFYETFHGTPSTETVDVVESIHEHDNLTPLGGLRELVVHTLSGYKLAKTWGEDKTGDVHDIPFLCSSEDGNQLYIRGGDQTIDLDSIKMGPSTKWNKEKIVVGDIHLITYRTRKSFDKFKDIDYFHKLGEETRVRPTLVYDTRSQLMEIVGGQYHIDDPLIGVSRGIIN